MAENSGQKKHFSIPVMKDLKDKQTIKNLAEVKHTLFVMSGKGGVGKSSVTANLGVALADMGKKVGIIDIDLHGPSIPGLLRVNDPVLMEEKQMIPVKWIPNPNLCLMSIDLLIPDRDTAIQWRGPMKSGVVQQFLTDVHWGALDYLIIDSPPGTGDEHMTIMDAIPSAQCIVVTTPQEVSLADVRKALDFLRSANAKILGLVENMSGLVCPHCGEEIDLFGKGGGEELAKKRGIPFLGAIPLDLEVVTAADIGLPAVRLPNEESAARKALLALAQRVVKNTNMDA